MVTKSDGNIELDWKGRLLSTETLEVNGYVTLVNRSNGRVRMYIRPVDHQDTEPKDTTVSSPDGMKYSLCAPVCTVCIWYAEPIWYIRDRNVHNCACVCASVNIAPYN
jgi:hypothetical protein